MNGRSAVLPAGTVQLLLPGDAHGIGCAPGCEFVRIFNCNVLREEFQKEFLHFSAELEIAPDDLLARGMIPPGARRKLIFEDCETLLARRGKFGPVPECIAADSALAASLGSAAAVGGGGERRAEMAARRLRGDAPGGELPCRFEAAGGALRPDAGAT